MSCLDCHVNFHTTGQFHLNPDTRPQLDRLRLDTVSLRGMFNQQIHGSKRSLRSVEDFTEFEQRTAYFNGDPIRAMKKGMNVIDRLQVAHMAQMQNMIDFPPAPKLNTMTGPSIGRRRRRRKFKVKGCFSGKHAVWPVINRPRTPTIRCMTSIWSASAPRPTGRSRRSPSEGSRTRLPYFHDGRLLTLEDTVEFFNLVLELKLNQEEKARVGRVPSHAVSPETREEQAPCSIRRDDSKGSPKWGWGGPVRTLVWAVATIGIFAGPVVAEEVEPPPPPRDCRYLQTEDPAAARTADEHRGERFPKDDVFRPLTADPKEPRFLASYQRVRFRDANESINAGFVGFGENFGLWGKRQEKGCDGWQIGVLGAVFSQFNLDGPSTDLINSDFLMGFPLTWRYGILSGRVRAYHQSSHLGDEFILHRPGFQRINLSFEEIDSLVSLDLWWVRLYGGGGFIVHREPELKRGKAQWGLEIRGLKRPDVHSREIRS